MKRQRCFYCGKWPARYAGYLHRHVQFRMFGCFSNIIDGHGYYHAPKVMTVTRNMFVYDLNKGLLEIAEDEMLDKWNIWMNDLKGGNREIESPYVQQVISPFSGSQFELSSDIVDLNNALDGFFGISPFAVILTEWEKRNHSDKTDNHAMGIYMDAYETDGAIIKIQAMLRAQGHKVKYSDVPVVLAEAKKAQLRLHRLITELSNPGSDRAYKLNHIRQDKHWEPSRLKVEVEWSPEGKELRIVYPVALRKRKEIVPEAALKIYTTSSGNSMTSSWP